MEIITKFTQNHPTISIIATWLTIISGLGFVINIVYMGLKFIYQKFNPKKKPLAINDTFAKEEAELWIEYRVEFQELTYDFIQFVGTFSGSISILIKDEKKFSDFYYDVQKILKKQKLMKIYFEEKIYDKTMNILNIINMFCFIFKDDIFELRDETANLKVLKDNSELKEKFVEIIEINLKPQQKPDKNSFDEYLGLFSKEIDQINKALNEKVTAHLKK